MKHYRVVCLMYVLALLLGSCSEAEPVRIKIVCTSDVHGNFFPYDFLTDKPAQGSLARVSSYLSALRSSEAFGENVIYVDNGDILHGQPTSYYYNTVALSQCHLAAEALNYLGCEVAVLGNHDIETGGPTYQRYINDLECGVVGGNIYFEDTEHYTDEFVESHYKRCMENFDLNMAFFSKLDNVKFNKCLDILKEKYNKD